MSLARNITVIDHTSKQYVRSKPINIFFGIPRYNGKQLLPTSSRNYLSLSEAVKRLPPSSPRVRFHRVAAPSLLLLGQIQLPVEIKHGHDEIWEPAKTPIVAHPPRLQAMLLLQPLPRIEMLGNILSWLGPRAARWRRYALESKVLAYDGPLGAPGGWFLVVGDVVRLAAGGLWVQDAPDGELGDDVLAAVVAEGRPALLRAGEGDFRAFAFHGDVRREVEGQCLREAVDVVVGHVADDHVRSEFAPGPGFACGLLGELVDLVVVEHLRRVGLGDTRERLGVGEVVLERVVVDEVDAVCFGAGGEDEEFEVLREVLDGADGSFQQRHVDGDFLCWFEVHDVREEEDVRDRVDVPYPALHLVLQASLPLFRQEV